MNTNYTNRLGKVSTQQASIQTQNNLLNLNNLANRLNSNGGSFQQDRMIENKKDSLHKALLYSYQAANVCKDTDIVVRALINPNRLNADYDEKVISIDFEHGYKCGDVFEWLGTNTHWIIYLQQLSELAYFRGNIRKCSHEISWLDTEGNKYSTYIALRGPVEQSLDNSIKHAISVDSPNYTLSFLVPNNENTKKYFVRYSEFYLKNSNVCWRVEAVDDITSPGVIEVYAKEYFANDQEDADGVVGSLIETPQFPDSEIEGETFIKTKRTYTYTYKGEKSGEWQIDKKYPIEYEINGNSITLKWTASYSGQFDLSFGNEVKKTIVVESLF